MFREIYLIAVEISFNPAGLILDKKIYKIKLRNFEILITDMPNAKYRNKCHKYSCKF